jgi:hypothetical protein
VKAIYSDPPLSVSEWTALAFCKWCFVPFGTEQVLQNGHMSRRPSAQYGPLTLPELESGPTVGSALHFGKEWFSVTSLCSMPRPPLAVPQQAVIYYRPTRTRDDQSPAGVDVYSPSFTAMSSRRISNNCLHLFTIWTWSTVGTNYRLNYR